MRDPKNVILGGRLRVFGDLVSMLRRSRRWWLFPLLSVLVLLGLALAGLQAVQVVAPFIYAVL
jgi:hypothetical protein